MQQACFNICINSVQQIFLKYCAKKYYQKCTRSQAMVVHTFNPSTCEAEAGGFLSSKPAWSTQIEFQDSQVYTEKPCLKKQKNKHKHKKNPKKNPKNKINTTQYSGGRRGTGDQMDLGNTRLKEVQNVFMSITSELSLGVGDKMKS